MKNTHYVLGLLVLSLGFVACNKSDSNSTGANPGAEKMSGDPVSIEPGLYEVTPTCDSEEKTADLPKVKMVFDLKEDGTYVQSIKSQDYTCLAKNGCEALFEGNYQASTTNFLFEQSVLATNEGVESKVVVESQDFAVVEYNQEKGSIVLVNDQPDNACKGELTWTLAKQVEQVEELEQSEKSESSEKVETAKNSDKK